MTLVIIISPLSHRPYFMSDSTHIIILLFLLMINIAFIVYD